MSITTTTTHTAALKAVLFDMDDTLINWQTWDGSWHGTEERHLLNVYAHLEGANRRLNGAFEAFHEHYKRLTREAWAEARMTLRAPHIGRLMLESLTHFGFLPDEAVSLDHCLEAYGWGCIPGIHVFPDVVPFLELLQQRGIKMGIVTNASQPMTLRDHELTGYDLIRFFPETRHRISAADVGWLKPHAEIFRHALDALGTSPDETIFIGDNPVADVAGAQSAGMRAVWRMLTHVTMPTPKEGLVVPDAAVRSFAELPALLDQWYPNRW